MGRRKYIYGKTDFMLLKIDFKHILLKMWLIDYILTTVEYKDNHHREFISVSCVFK